MFPLKEQINSLTADVKKSNQKLTRIYNLIRESDKPALTRLNEIEKLVPTNSPIIERANTLAELEVLLEAPSLVRVI